MKKLVLGMALFGALGLTPAWASFDDDSSDECGTRTCQVDSRDAGTQRFLALLATRAAEAAAVLCAADLEEFNSLVEATIEVMRSKDGTTYRICRVRKNGRVKCSRKQIIPADQVPVQK